MAASRDLAHRARGLAAQARRATPASARPTTSWVPRGSSSPTRSTSARACRLARRSGRATPPTARATTARRAPRPATTTVRRRARGPRWGQCWSQWWDLYWDLYWNQSVGSARAPYGLWGQRLLPRPPPCERWALAAQARGATPATATSATPGRAAAPRFARGEARLVADRPWGVCSPAYVGCPGRA